MAAKKRLGIPVSELVRSDLALPPHRRKLHRQARESAVSTDGSASLQDKIEAEYVRLADADKKNRDAQSERARKPRGRSGSDDGRTTSELVADIVKGNPAAAPPADLLQRIHTAMEENGMERITDKWATALVRTARKKP